MCNVLYVCCHKNVSSYALHTTLIGMTCKLISKSTASSKSPQDKLDKTSLLPTRKHPVACLSIRLLSTFRSFNKNLTFRFVFVSGVSQCSYQYSLLYVHAILQCNNNLLGIQRGLLNFIYATNLCLMKTAHPKVQCEICHVCMRCDT